MTIEYKRNVASLQGVVTVDDAESLLAWLQGHKKAKVTLAACTHMHCANLLILLALRPLITAWPEDRAFAKWLTTSLPSIEPD
ncbi:MAG: hypothetical protein HIU89_04130 [Proteobacteria bacterium]|nr:hypothetical protein [Pseudomonadota bacterium]